MSDEALIEQLVNDLNQAHDEICKLQGTTPELQDWPEWSPQANSIREAEKRLGKRLAKTRIWSEFPDSAREAESTD